jgi:hypothetical protein
MSPNSTRDIHRRERTPIRHHRRSIPRGRSGSRTEMLMGYATEQQLEPQPPTQQMQQASLNVVPSQSAPTTPQIFNLPGNYGSMPAGGYFPSTAVSHIPQDLQDYGFHEDQHYEDFYTISRSASGSLGMPSMNPQDVYLGREGQQSGISSMQPLPGQAPFPPMPATLESSHNEPEVSSSRPKPQCWEHGCNGRQFSTFSNLLRHQREKSGSALKAICPYCGTEFTRTTARNGHMYGGKCKGRGDKDSAGSSPGPSKQS